MAKALVSGLAIGGAAAAIVVAGVVVYIGVVKETPPDKVTEVVAQTQPVPDVKQPEPAVVTTAPEAVKPEPEVEEVEPDVVKPEPEVVEVVPEVAEPETKVVAVEPDVVKPEPEVVEVVPEVAEPETKVAIAEPEPAPAPVIPEPPKVTVPPTPPGIDLVRVDKAGSTVVAGKAAANTTVEILLDGAVVGEAITDATGAFVVLLDLEPSERPRELTLNQKRPSGEDVASLDKVLVMPFKPEATAAPKLVVAKDNTVEVIAPAQPTELAQTETANPETEQPETTEVETAKVAVAQTETAETKTPDLKIAEAQATQTNTTEQNAAVNPQIAASEDLSLDTILYDDLGDVVISGRGNRDDFVRIYLDNKPADIQKVSNDGQWKITLADVPDGIYELRVDSVDNKGAVTERVESPFKREAAELVAGDAERPASNITIQPGYTLWAVAKNRYGSGMRYVQIYDANRDRIKDPNLIYPGQVFDLPN